MTAHEIILELIKLSQDELAQVHRELQKLLQEKELLNKYPPSEKFPEHFFKGPEVNGKSPPFHSSSTFEENFDAALGESDEVKYLHSPEVVSDLAAKLLDRKIPEEGDFTNVVHQALKLLNASHKALDEDLYEFERKADSYAMDLVPWKKALLQITRVDRIDRAEDYYYAYLELRQDKISKVQLNIWKEKGYTPYEIAKERARYLQHKQKLDHESRVKGGEISAARRKKKKQQ